MAAQLASNELLPTPVVDSRYRVGAWVIVASVSMLFTGLSSAYIVRAASASDWQALALPKVLWLSTALIFLSSLTFELGRKSLKKEQVRAYVRGLTLTGVLGLGFVVLQVTAWRQLARQGVYLASNPLHPVTHQTKVLAMSLSIRPLKKHQMHRAQPLTLIPHP